MTKLVAFEGKNYSFPDDATDDEMFGFIDAQTKPASTLDVLKAVPENLIAQGMKGLQGTQRMAEDVPILGAPFKAGRELADRLGLTATPEQLQAVEQKAKEATPANMSYLQEQALGAGTNVLANTIPALVSGAGATTAVAKYGVPAAAAIKGAIQGTLLPMAVGEAGKEYVEQLDSGASKARAGIHAAVTGFAEYWPETWGSFKLAEAVAGKTPIGKAALEFMLKDLGGEELTTTIEWLNEKLSRSPDTTLGDLAKRIKDTAVQTLMAGPVQAGAIKVGGAITNAAAAKLAGQPAQTVQPQVTPEPVQQPQEAPMSETASPVAETLAPRGKLVNESDLPIIGMPGDSQDKARQLSIEDQLTLLRKSYDDLQRTSFQDDALIRVQKRGDFQARRAAVEADLALHPEGRMFLLATDEDMGIQRPDVNTNLEQEVNDFATLSPEQAQQRAALRETTQAEGPWYGKSLAAVPMTPTTSITSALDVGANEAPSTAAEIDANPEHHQAAVDERLAGHPVLRSSNPELTGLPFEQAVQQAKPEDIVVVGQPGEENAANSADLMALLQSYKERFLPNSTLFVGRTPGLASGRLSSAWKIPGTNAYAMDLPLDMEGDFQSRLVPGAGPGSILSLEPTRSLSTRLDTVSHEFTHILHMAHWDSATNAEKTAVAKEYHDDLRYAYSASVVDAVRRLYSAKTAEWMIARVKSAGIPLATKFSDPGVQQALGFRKLNDKGVAASHYWFNFSEWMAHKGVKYFQTRLGVARENVPFFRRWVAKMKAFYNSYSAQHAAPGPAFAQFMDNIALRESRGLGIATEEDIAQARQKMVEAGVDPKLAELLSTVKGDQRQVLQQIANKMEQKREAYEVQDAYEKGLGTLGEPFFNSTSHASISKAFAGNELAQTLLASPRFSNPMTFNAAEFAHSLYANVFALGTAERMNAPQNSYFVFTLPRNNPITAVYEKSTGVLTVDASAMFTKEAENSAALGATTQVLEALAKDGITTVDVTGLPKEVQKALVGKEKGVDGRHFELPYWAFEEATKPVEVANAVAPEVPELRLPQGLHAIGSKFGIPWLTSGSNSIGRFNWLYGKALGAYELIHLNANVPGMQEERAALRNRMMYRHQWLAAANAQVEEWAYGIEKTQAAKLGRLLFDEAESGIWHSTKHADPNKPGHYIFAMDPAIAAKRGLDQKTQELYSKVRNDFYLFAEEWHKVALWEMARGELSDVTQHAIHKMMQEPGGVQQAMHLVEMEITATRDPVKMKRLDETFKRVNDEFIAWKNKPYMPFTRFGRYGALVRDGQTGKSLYFSGHDSLGEARETGKELQQKFPGSAVSVQYLEDNVYELAGLPPSMLEAMKTKLQLDPQQQEVFSKVLQQLSLANSFKHHAAHKAGIAGYSEDALRAYSDYFRRGSSFMARVKSNPELADANRLLEKYIQQVTAQPGLVDVSNLRRLHEWLQRHHEYLNNAGVEHGQLKSLVAMFHFTGNISSALVNLMQVPMVTLPWLSERYGITDASKELGKAYKDALQMWTNKSKLAGDEQAMYEHALSSGFVDESQATTIGQMADGAALSRATLTGWGQRTVGAVNHYGMWMFSKAEQQNRVATLLAAYRLAKKDKFYGKFDQNAYDFARQAVEDTQNEYAQENRPEIMRGKGGVVLQFMHYTTHMLFMQLGGDKSWWRLLTAQLLAGGLLGLPFAEDLINASKFIARKAGIGIEPELALRELLVSLGANQDLVARGLFNDMFGFDLSNRVSMGQVVPGMRALGSQRKFDQVLYEAVGDVGGPGVSLVANALKFLSEDDKLAWRTMSKVLPTAVKNIGNAGQALATGEVKDGSGVKVFEPDTWDAIGMAAGFQPKELSKHYLTNTLQGEQAAYWVNRKQAMLDIWDSVVNDRNQDREVQADFMKRLGAYNEDAPPGMRLTGEQLRQSAIGRAKARAVKEMGLGSTRGTRTEAAEISDTLKR